LNDSGFINRYDRGQENVDIIFPGLTEKSFNHNLISSKNGNVKKTLTNVKTSLDENSLSRKDVV
jgi:hypothetical protein